MELNALIELLFGLMGGLGIFLLGMKNMSDGMQAVAGASLRRLMIIAIAFVFGGTRHENTTLILQHTWQTGRWITGFMAVIFIVICILDWLM